MNISNRTIFDHTLKSSIWISPAALSAALSGVSWKSSGGGDSADVPAGAVAVSAGVGVGSAGASPGTSPGVAEIGGGDAAACAGVAAAFADVSEGTAGASARTVDVPACA